MSEFSEYAFKITEKGASVSSGTLSSMIEMESPSEEQLAKDRITDNVQIENKQFDRYTYTPFALLKNKSYLYCRFRKSYLKYSLKTTILWLGYLVNVAVRSSLSTGIGTYVTNAVTASAHHV